MTLDRIAAAVGKGLFAGIAGTAAMTLSSTIEMRVQRRGGSSVPADAICKVFGVEALGEQEKSRLTNAVHWAYGTTQGVLRGALAVAGLRRTGAASAFFALVWGGEVITLPALGLTPPITRWGKEAIATDVAHHLVYALATSLAYDALDPG